MIKYIDEYQNKTLVDKLLKQIEKKAAEIEKKQINLMEVCGTHTVAIFRLGIREVLPEKINLISGPGCPVCVTSSEDIDLIIQIAQQPNVITATFGDMIKVPGSRGSLEQLKASGADIRVVYSPLDVIDIAQKEPDKKIVFLGIGFETTAPTIAAMLAAARQQKVKNLFVLPVCKVIPPAMKVLLDDKTARVDGFLLPGHVSIILGTEPYEFIAQDYHLSGVIAGFEPLDILEAVYMLLEQISAQDPKIEIAYKRSVRPEGNPQALKILYEVFQPRTAAWRGLGRIPASGLVLRPEYEDFDAEKVFNLSPPEPEKNTGCLCGEVLKGKITPEQCGLFKTKCTPETPKGPCMVSTEGTCAAYYKYSRG